MLIPSPTMRKELSIKLFDEDTFSDDVLGHVRVDLGDITINGQV